MSKYDWIINHMPYGDSFLFIGEILECDANSIKANYLFQEDAYFYESHFINNPITPGVIITECMAQIGLVAFGISLLGKNADFKNLKIGMSSTKMDFYKPVVPGTKVTVESELQYFRFNKLKCQCIMKNDDLGLIAKGEISGMLMN